MPWTSFTRIVDRYRSNAGVRTRTSAEQFRAIAFAQFSWRENLRDIEVSSGANPFKLDAMAFARRSSAPRWLTPTNRATGASGSPWPPCWSGARKLYASESLGVELDNTVYALDSSTIDLCLSLFDWAPFRSTKAAIRLHTLLDLHGAILAFIHISDGKLHNVNVLDMLTF